MTTVQSKSSRRRLLTAGALVLVLAVAGWLYLQASATPRYASKVTLFVGTTSSVPGAEGDVLAEGRVTALQSLLTSEELATRVIADTGIDRSVEQVQSEISSERADDTVLLTVTVLDDSPERSLTIATWVARNLELTVDQLADPPDLVLKIVSAPALDPEPV